MPNLTFSDTTEFFNRFAVSGTIDARTYRVHRPELAGQVTIDGGLVITVPRPKPLAPLAGQFTVHGTLAAGVKAPAAAFKDFSHYPYQGVDPAKAWIGITSGSLKSAVSGSYSRPYTAITGPVDYPVSGGGYAWKRAAYAAVGFKFASMSANKHQILDAVQFEPLPLGATGPSAYQNARELRVVVKPTRLNYADNPNFESGITGTSALNGATLEADSSTWWRGTQSLKVTVPSNPTANAGFNFAARGLIPGRRYTLSARIAIAQSCGSVYPWSSSTSTTMKYRTWYKDAPQDATNPRWRTVSVTFDAKASVCWVGFSVERTTMPSGQPSIYWVDGVLVEEGGSVRDYFDGSMGEDYLWESSGTANLARSYFYENYVERSYLIRTLLEENVPLGTTSSVPQYAVLPTQ
ncbi:hypothetical protein [Streptomyces sp. NPDC002088]|uniref:hypothetical protein n=1 Tax=Streptomyces sp. NPDC002088 TaxID=3154665 RepID=UPI003328B4C1